MPPENSQNSSWLARDLRGKPEKHFRAYVSLFMRHLCEPGNDNAETFTDGVPREGMSRQQVLTRIGTMALIRKKVKEFEEYNGEFSVPLQELNSMNDEQANVTANGEPAEKQDEENVKVKTEKVDENEKAESKEPSVDESNGKAESESEKPANENDESNKESADKAEQAGNDENGAESKAADEKEINEESRKEEETMEVDQQDKQPAKEDDKESKETHSDQAKDTTKSPIKKELSADEEEEGKTKENKENDRQNEPNHSRSSTEKASKPKFMFNIADGGFTELHAIWQTEEKAAAAADNLYETWHRRHDYWLLAGIVKHGYARWQDIQADPVFDIINEPFKGDLNKGNFIEIKNKFIIRRFKLLEQALAIEEQLKRAQQLKLAPEQNSPVLSLNTKFNEMECIAEANQHLVKEQASGAHSKQATVVLKNVLNQLDELLNDMKMDANRLPQTLTRVQTVSQRLLLSERTILSRLAGQAQAQQAQLLQRQLLVQQALQQQQLQAQLLQQLQSQLTPEQIQMIQQGLLNSNR